MDAHGASAPQAPPAPSTKQSGATNSGKGGRNNLHSRDGLRERERASARTPMLPPLLLPSNQAQGAQHRRVVQVGTQPGDGDNGAKKAAWARIFGTTDPDAAAKLPWKFVATYNMCKEAPKWNQQQEVWEHSFWERSRLNGDLSVKLATLTDRNQPGFQFAKQLKKIQKEKEPQSWPSPSEPASASASPVLPTTHDTNRVRYIELRVVQTAYESGLLQTISKLDSSRVTREVQKVVQGTPLTTNTGPFFARLWFEDAEGWEGNKLKLYIGKTSYAANRNLGSANAIIRTDPDAPLAELFKANEMLGLRAPIATKVNPFINNETSTITVQAFEDESCGYNYNWRFMWARFRAAEVANDDVKQYVKQYDGLPEDEELQFR